MADSEALKRATDPTRGESLWGETKAMAKKYLGPKEDTSWHDSMVKSANESFRKASADPKLGSAKKKSAKKKAKKQAKKR
jgi:hypothetical protein